MGLRDIRYAIRSLVHDRGVSAVVIACLALGIGVNATLFSLIDGVLLQPLPFAEPDRLVILNEAFVRGGVDRAGASYKNIQDWKERTTSLTSIAAVFERNLAVSDGTETERFQGAAITWDMFQVLGVQPILGRHFNAADDRVGAEPVVILSHEVWQRRYQGDPGIIGRSVTVNGRPNTVVAVMPPQFSFPENQKIWIPLAPLTAKDVRQARYLFTFGRLKPGVELAQARAEMASVAEGINALDPKTDGWSLLLTPITEDFVPDDVRLILWTMMGAVTLVLLIACANVANLMLARASGRQREFGVRAALGAGRALLVRQLLTECVLLGLAAAPLGLAIAYVGVWLLDQAVPVGEVPYYIHWEISGRGIAYTIGIAALTGLVFGLAPALQAGRLNLQETLRDGARGAGQSGRRAWLRNTLVVLEVAMALVLLIGASLFVRSFLNLQGAMPNFDTAPLMTLRVYMTGEAYAGFPARTQRVEDLMRRIESLPQVEAAFASSFMPLEQGGGEGSNVIVDGRPVADGEEHFASFTGVTPHLHKTLGLALLKGRDFTEAEGASRSQVAVINDTMARTMWPGSDPIGRRFRMKNGDPPEWLTVIGVAPDIRRDSVTDDEAPTPAAFVSYHYRPSPNNGITIRTSAADPASLTAALRAEIRASDPALAIFNVQTMETLRTAGFWQFRLFGYMFSIFGAAALFLATIGVYGVLSFSVSQRTQEMGVRIALGAKQSDVLALVVRQGFTLAMIGVVVGLIGAFGITRVIQSLLFNVGATDPLSFIGVAVFLTAIAVLASYLPARRATAVDPIVALRNE